MAGRNKKGVSGGDEDLGDFLVAFGARIRELRAAAGLSQRALGEVAGVTQAYLYLVEAGRQNSTLTVLRRLARAFGVSMASLLPGEDSPEIAPVELVRLADEFRGAIAALEGRRQGDVEIVEEMQRLTVSLQRLIDVGLSKKGGHLGES